MEARLRMILSKTGFGTTSPFDATDLTAKVKRPDSTRKLNSAFKELPRINCERRSEGIIAGSSAIRRRISTSAVATMRLPGRSSTERLLNPGLGFSLSEVDRDRLI